MTHVSEEQQLLLTIPQVCDMLQVGRTTVYRFIGDGRIRVVHLGRSVRVRADDVRVLVEELTESQAD
jgi:excisionase family DNA binding protein